MENQDFGVLQGIRVLDLTRMLAGPFCTMMLADHGAEVIKVEAPGGDPTRYAGPFAEDSTGLGGFFQSVNRNKKSLVLDLKREEGAALFKTMVKTADVVVENFRPGVMDDLGLSYEVLKQLNPKLVFASISGFGDARNGASPRSQWPAFDPIAQAVGGIVSITGLSEDEPVRAGTSLGDIIPGMYAAFGILAAVHRANKTGESQHVDVAMADSILSLCECAVYKYSYAGQVQKPAGNHHHLAAPAGLFKVKDGWVSIAAMQDSHWEILCQGLNMESLLQDSRFEDALKRRNHLVELEEALDQFLRNYSKSEIMEKLGGKIPIAPVQNIEDIFADPHFAAREMLVEVDEPGIDQKKTVTGTPVKFNETPGGVKHRAPLLGEHTASLLQEVGIDETAISELVESAAVVCI